MKTWSFAKGHGTRNDFVILFDGYGTLDVTPEIVRYLCDRRSGHRRRRRPPGREGRRDPRLGRRPRPVVHGLPERRRVDGRDVRQRAAGVRPVPGRRGPRRRAGPRHRHAGRAAQRAPVPGRSGQGRHGHGDHRDDHVRAHRGVHVTRASAVDVGNPHLVSLVPASLDDVAAAEPDGRRERRHRGVPSRRERRARARAGTGPRGDAGARARRGGDPGLRHGRCGRGPRRERHRAGVDPRRPARRHRRGDVRRGRLRRR